MEQAQMLRLALSITGFIYLKSLAQLQSCIVGLFIFCCKTYVSVLLVVVNKLANNIIVP